MSDTLVRWVGWVQAKAWWVLVAVMLATIASSFYVADRFRLNSDLNGLIDQTSDWRVQFDAFRDAFPDMVKTMVVVVHGDSFGAVEETAKAIEARVRGDAAFRAVSAPQNDAFLRDHALLYLSLDDLDDMADRLAEAQPVLTAIAEDASLREVLLLLCDSFARGEVVAGREAIIDLLGSSAEAFLSGGDGRIRWADELFDAEGMHTRVVTLKGTERLDETLPAAALLSRLQTHIDAVQRPTGVQVLTTGEIALTHEEIGAALSGVQIAGWLSLVFLVLIMALGVRSLKIVVATLLMLVCGVVLTAAWAMLSVGEFNTLSLVFIVMFFGLGVDFALHFSLRYQEAVNADVPVADALTTTARSVGMAIFICTATTALGFLSFWPTDYRGVADLGVISAGGMVVAAALTFTLLPAVYAVAGGIRHHEIDLPTGDRLVRWLISHKLRVFLVLGVLAVASLVVASRAYFDYSVLALRDEGAPSMQGLRLLQREGVATDYALYLVHDDDTTWADTVTALETVDEVVLPRRLVPKDQDDKLFVLEDLRQMLASALEPQRRAAVPQARELAALLERTAEVLERSGDPAAAHLGRLLVRIAGSGRAETWQRAVIDDAVEELAWLRRALNVDAVGFDDLPAALRDRVVDAQGRQLSVILPAGDVSSTDALTRFVESVRAVVPEATGRPVIEWGVGEIVRSAFVQAMTGAVLAIYLVLALVFRSLRDAALIMLPLTLAALFTLAFCVLAGQPINMASVLVIPLIFGLGVDNGIHVFDRYRRSGDVSRLLHSSTPRAVMLSTLTTVFAFSSLMLSPHAGTASIGLLLSVAVLMLLIFTIFLLPVLLHKH